MFYQLIGKKRDEWLRSDHCTVRTLLDYMIRKGFMRDAQVEAIKTWLFLKIACDNKPLWQLFTEGVFNSLDMTRLELTAAAREVLTANKSAAALLEYALLKDKNGNQAAPALEAFIKQHPSSIDYSAVLKKIFYGVAYPDYLFSLPMGAGKTFLMAAFIYLDLYFAWNEPENPRFAHNFVVLAPSGLKSSIVPSLKHIQEFDPSWIIPEPTASQLRRLIKFEILDEQKTAGKSNRIKNPNAQKINYYQPLDDLMGLVAVTNAEKVILDRLDGDTDPALLSREELRQFEVANELREIIGRIPSLSIFIDEVHHAADGDIKLRQVVNGWTEKHTFNSVLGFSGTPYLDSAEKVTLAEQFSVKNTNLSNVVYYYPLINGIGNFLKNPAVKYAEADPEVIVSQGVKEFLENYGNLVYAHGACAKMAIYCSRIETLEETIFPLVSQIAGHYGFNPSEVILKYHEGNRQYPKPEGAEAAFASLDTALSKIKIVLLVQIGKEGWDCKSLTGVILPQKGACPTNMVLQTSCRCLRQVAKNHRETALIWMNKFNADTLNKQLKQQQNITLKEFGGKQWGNDDRIERYSRMDYLQVPPIDFYQLKVSYETMIVDEASLPAERLRDNQILSLSDVTLILQQDMEGRIVDTYGQEATDEIHATTFQWWLHQIARESMGTLPVASLMTCESELRKIFARITLEKDGKMIENASYDHQRIRSLVRQAFAPLRDLKVVEEIVPEKASLLQIEKLASPVEGCEYDYPDQKAVHQILEWDGKPDNPPTLTPDEHAMLALLVKQGKLPASVLQPQTDPCPERRQTYHYLPYRFDRGFEKRFFAEEIVPLISGRPVELYYNGDVTLTSFKINCYSRSGKGWRYIGKYVPDFLLLSRNERKEIDKIIIVETKGEGFAAKFKEKRDFMAEFVQKNNDKFGYRRFDFLYLEDTLTSDQRRRKVLSIVNDFFNNGRDSL